MPHDERQRLVRLSAEGDAGAAWRLRELARRTGDTGALVAANAALADLDALVALAAEAWRARQPERCRLALEPLGLAPLPPELDALERALLHANGRRRQRTLTHAALVALLVEARMSALGFAVCHAGQVASGHALSTIALAVLDLEAAHPRALVLVDAVPASDPRPPLALLGAPWHADPRDNVATVRAWVQAARDADALGPIVALGALPVLAVRRPTDSRAHAREMLRATDGAAWRDVAEPLELLRERLGEVFRDRALDTTHPLVVHTREALADAPDRAAALDLALELLGATGPAALRASLRWLLAHFEGVTGALAARLERGRLAAPSALGAHSPPSLEALLDAVLEVAPEHADPLLLAGLGHRRDALRARCERALLERADPPTPALLALLDADTPSARRSAASLLVRLVRPEDLGPADLARLCREATDAEGLQLLERARGPVAVRHLSALAETHRRPRRLRAAASAALERLAAHEGLEPDALVEAALAAPDEDLPGERALIARLLAHRRERDMLLGTRFDPGTFDARFVAHPHFARAAHGLLYERVERERERADGDDEGTCLFALTGGAPRDLDARRVALVDGRHAVRLAHPARLDPALRLAWLDRLAGAAPPFAQLERAHLARGAHADASAFLASLPSVDATALEARVRRSGYHWHPDPATHRLERRIGPWTLAIELSAPGERACVAGAWGRGPDGERLAPDALPEVLRSELLADAAMLCGCALPA